MRILKKKKRGAASADVSHPCGALCVSEYLLFLAEMISTYLKIGRQICGTDIRTVFGNSGTYLSKFIFLITGSIAQSV